MVFLFYPESALKSLEEMDLLFASNRSIFVFNDKDATKVGAIIERDLAHGEALSFNPDGEKQIETVETVETIPKYEA